MLSQDKITVSATSPAPSADAVALLLARHAVRRSAAVPTVSVLIGPVGAGNRAWRAWAAGSGIAVVTGNTTNENGITNLVIQAVGQERNLLDDACAFLAEHTGRSSGEIRASLAAMTQRDIDDFFTANDRSLPAGHATRLAREILLRAAKGIGVGPFIADSEVEPLSRLAGLAKLIPATALPAALLFPPSSIGLRDWLSAVGAAATMVATRNPMLALGIAVPAIEWREYSSTGRDNRVMALLREGAIELPVLDQLGVEQVLRESGVEPPIIPPTIRSIVAGGVPSEFARATAEATTAPTGATTPADDDQARSAAEKFLFEFLELLPDTAGRFELNASPGFRFRSREAEIDLLDLKLRIAIEIDGYYHFRDPDGYRRDREKDWELERHGFLVLRFLADDIIPRLEEVRDRILAAVALRAASGALV